MSHVIVKTLLIPRVINLIAQRYQCSEEEACDRFYRSATCRCLDDADTGLYGQSALYIFSLYVAEEQRAAGIANEDLQP